MKLYPYFIVLLLIGCHNIELDEANKDLHKKLEDVEWINRYDSLEVTASDYFKTISDAWKNPGFTSFGWHDSLWHFVYGNVRLSFNVEVLLSLKNAKIHRDSINSINETFTTSAFYALLTSKFFVIDSLHDSIKQFNFYLKDKANDNIVWIVRKLPKVFDSAQLSKFGIYILHIDPTGHEIKNVERFRIGNFKFENNDALNLAFVTPAIPIQAIYCALCYKQNFRKISIETLEHKVVLESRNGKDEWNIKKSD